MEKLSSFGDTFPLIYIKTLVSVLSVISTRMQKPVRCAQNEEGSQSFSFVFLGLVTANCTVAGRYINTDNGQCEMCPVGTYNSQWWADSCTQCPTDFTTKTTGIATIDNCYSRLNCICLGVPVVSVRMGCRHISWCVCLCALDCVCMCVCACVCVCVCALACVSVCV